MFQRICPSLLVCTLLLSTPALAAPKPKPKTACEQCKEDIQQYDSASKSLFTQCFSIFGERSPGQHYCLLELFFESWAVLEPTLVPAEKARPWMESCVAEHQQELTPDTELDLSDERQAQCIWEYSERSLKISIQRYNCDLLCNPPPKPTERQESYPSDEVVAAPQLF